MARIVTIGGSISGLAVALLAARQGHDVTVVERDPAPLPSGVEDAWERWERRGVPHLRQAHLFLARGRNLLRDRAPDVLAALGAAGASEVRLLDRLPSTLAGRVPTHDADDLVRLGSRRTTFEYVLRSALESQPGVKFAPGVTVAGLVASPEKSGPDSGVARVTGVRILGGGSIPADLVVDGSGRRSAAAQWLAASVGHTPEQLRTQSGLVYLARWYRRREGAPAPSAVRVDLGYASCRLDPADAGVFSVTFKTAPDDIAMRALLDQSRFQAAAEAVVPIAPWVSPDCSTPLGGVGFMGGLVNQLRRTVVDGCPLASGVILVGDAAMCTNPTYGRGVSLSLVHAAAAVEVLATHAEDPTGLALAFDRVTRDRLEPWYHAAAASDHCTQVVRRSVLNGRSPWEATAAERPVRFAWTLPFAAERDPVVFRAYTRMMNLLDPPATVFDDLDLRQRVEVVWHELVADRPPSPTPNRDTMIRILTA